jgi:hypothetical protein
MEPLRMRVVGRTDHLIERQQIAAIKQLSDRGSLFRFLYLTAIGLAMIGWLWLIPWLAIRLF